MGHKAPRLTLSRGGQAAQSAQREAVQISRPLGVPVLPSSQATESHPHLLVWWKVSNRQWSLRHLKEGLWTGCGKLIPTDPKAKVAVGSGQLDDICATCLTSQAKGTCAK